MPAAVKKNYPAGIPALTDESETELHYEAHRSWQVYAAAEEGDRWKFRPGQIGWVVKNGTTRGGKPSSMLVTRAKVQWDWRSHTNFRHVVKGRWDVTAVLQGTKINQDGSISYGNATNRLSLSELEAMADEFPADLYAWLVAHMKPTTRLKVEEVTA